MGMRKTVDPTTGGPAIIDDWRDDSLRVTAGLREGETGGSTG
jgi:hypothetical protein